MTTARINSFIKNSDFSTQKQRGRYTATVEVPADTYGFVTTFQTIIPISEGACIENVTLRSSFTGDETYSAHSLTYLASDYRVEYLVYQTDPSYYALRAIVICPSGSASVLANSASAVINMSLSPFVKS